MDNSTVINNNSIRSWSIPFLHKECSYVSLLEGTPQSHGMRSGYVVLAPGECVGEHTTGDAEEMLIPLSGSGELRVPGQAPVKIQYGCVLYNPPHTPHDVVNSGSEPLKYIYVVAEVPPK